MRERQPLCDVRPQTYVRGPEALLDAVERGPIARRSDLGAVGEQMRYAVSLVRCDIVIRSYWKDFAWLELCVGAIEQHCRGFGAVIVVIPRSSEPWLRRHPPLPAAVRLEIERDFRDDYLGQQVTKLHADRFSDAELICHVDSDCIFTRRVTPDDLIDDGGRPIIATRPYDELGRHWPWRRPTEAALGWSVELDFMQRPPFSYPRWLYAAVRDHIAAVHRQDIASYVTSRPPRGFSEFNALGAFAHARHADRFRFVDASACTEEAACRWYWSWAGLDDATRVEIEGLVGRRDGRP